MGGEEAQPFDASSITRGEVMFNTGVSFPRRRATRTGLRVTSDERRATIRGVFVTILYFCGVFLSLAPATGAEDVTVTTYYPSPRGVYDELRTTGDVRIGTTSAPAARLHVVQTNAQNAFRVDDANPDTTPFVIDQNGNVGIKTASPLADLHVRDDADIVNLRVTSDNERAGISLLSDNTGEVLIYTEDGSDDLRFQVGGTDRMTIESAAAETSITGELGIGTANPESPLHIVTPAGSGINEVRLEETGGSTLSLSAGGGVTRIASSDNLQIEAPGGTTRMIVLGTGNVGIGAGNPLSRLSVGADGFAATAIYGESGGAGSGVAGKGGGRGVEGWASLGAGAVAGVAGTTIDPATIPGGEIPNGAGVFGYGHTYGIRAVATDAGGTGVYGKGPAWAGDFIGDVRVSDDLFVGNDVDVQGDISVTGNITGDVSEHVDCSGCEATDVVVIDPDHDQRLRPSSKAYDSTVAGVISEKPSLKIGGSQSEIAKPLALAGLVRVKATTENGPIHRGDLLVTSSKPGHAMRADPDAIKPGMLLGKALEPLSEGDGAIVILVE